MHQELLYQFQLIQAIRNYFLKEEFLDVLTPPMVPNPGYEAHIHPFGVYSIVEKKLTDLYLHTSPEFHMKALLAEGFEKIFTISYCFRNEPTSPIHRPQFLMLEWYRAGERYEKIMEDCEQLIRYCLEYLHDKGVPLAQAHASDYNNFRCERYTIQELFQEYLHFDILEFLEARDLKLLIEKNFPEVPLPKSSNVSWDDYFFLLFLNKIETKLKDRRAILLYEFPYQLSALSTLKKEDPRVCERFEIYLNGIELCNCFNELTDLNIQKTRFQEQKAIKKSLYNYELPAPSILYKALEKGLPSSAGIALGVERLLVSLTDCENPFFL